MKKFMKKMLKERIKNFLFLTVPIHADELRMASSYQSNAVQ